MKTKYFSLSSRVKILSERKENMVLNKKRLEKFYKKLFKINIENGKLLEEFVGINDYFML